MGNIGKEALTSDTQLTFTCFLDKQFFAASSYIRDRREYKSQPPKKRFLMKHVNVSWVSRANVSFPILLIYYDTFKREKYISINKYERMLRAK